MALIDNILNGVRSKDIANWEDAFGHIVFGDKKWSQLEDKTQCCAARISPGGFFFTMFQFILF